MISERYGLADLVMLSLGFGSRLDADGIRYTEKGLKYRSEVERIVCGSSKRGDALASDILKILGIRFLLAADELSHVGTTTAMIGDVVSELDRSWPELCKVAEQLDSVLSVKRRKGRPYSPEGVLFETTAKIVSRMPHPGHRGEAGLYWDYIWMLYTMLRGRLEKASDIVKRKTVCERRKIIAAEMRATETAVGRHWRSAFPDRPPRLSREDRESIVSWANGDFSHLEQFTSRFQARFGT